MRYEILLNDKPAQQASNKNLAFAIYESLLDKLEPGQGLQLVDTEKGKVLRRWKRMEADELAAWKSRRIADRIQRDRERALEELKEFGEKVVEKAETDPMHQFIWNGETGFDAAARVQIAIEAANAYERFDHDWARVLANMQADILRHARSPQRSTSPMSNLGAEFYLAAKAALAEFMQDTLHMTDSK